MDYWKASRHRYDDPIALCGASHQTGWTGLVALLLQPPDKVGQALVLLDPDGQRLLLKQAAR
jgi:hypothetical protein